jgi:hypothetical protein
MNGMSKLVEINIYKLFFGTIFSFMKYTACN